MAETIVVTGATGHVGHALAEWLLKRGARVRAVARGAGRLQALAARGAEVRAGSLSDRAFLVEAFRGAAAAFAMIPPDYSAPDARGYQRTMAETIVAALGEGGVRRVVTLSSVGADLPSGTGPIAGLHDLEQRIDAAGLERVHLRPTFFMENHLSSVGLIKSAGINGSSLRPDLAIPQIATRDIAAAAAGYLADPSFTGHAVRYLLGPRDYTAVEATRILGAAIGRPDLAYVELPYDQTRQALQGFGFSPSWADAFVEMYGAFNEGRIRFEPRSPANTTPTTLEQFASDTFGPAFQG